MRFTVQEVDGRPVLLAEGAIDDQMIPRFAQARNDFHGQEIWLRSPGGDARVGNQAGRLIRDQGLTTHVPSGWACMGSCAFMFMGGITRSVDERGLIIVRMFTHVTDPQAIADQLARGGENADRLLDEIALDSRRIATDDNDYLIHMGVSRLLLTDIVYRMPGVGNADHPAPHRCLTREEMRRYNVVNTGGRPPPLAGTASQITAPPHN